MIILRTSSVRRKKKRQTEEDDENEGEDEDDEDAATKSTKRRRVEEEFTDEDEVNMIGIGATSDPLSRLLISSFPSSICLHVLLFVYVSQVASQNGSVTKPDAKSAY